MNKVELLAPAGNFDCLKVAIANGANAVYLGGKNFSARAFANNFDESQIIEAVNYAHLRNVKVYVTLNTLLNEKQIVNAMKMVDFYYQNKVDALLIQDLGLYYLIKNKYPDFELHCSTQMHIHNLKGVENAIKFGFKRVVVARESNLDFIKEACKLPIEIETFVHGAICVSYSGQCLMSSFSKNRSANKGMCAQCCRLKYDYYDENDNAVKLDTQYPLSPKDMYLLEDIKSLIEAGVSSFKIEGRMKSSAYVGYVTRLYRKAIDAYYDNLEYKPSSSEIKNLKVLFNRNFTNDYLFNKKDIFGQSTPNHLGIEIGETISYYKGKLKIRLSEDLSQFDGIRINDFGCIVNKLYKDNLLVSYASKGDYIEIECDHNINGIVYKTLDYKLESSINNFIDIKVPLDLIVDLYVDKNVRVNCYDFEYVSNIKPLKALTSPINYDSVYNQFSKMNDSVYYLKSLKLNNDNCFLPVSKLNEIRREFINAYNSFRLNSFTRKTINSSLDYVDVKEDSVSSLVQTNNQINGININYVINNSNSYVDDKKAVISDFSGLLLPYETKIGYYTLNVCNSYAYELLRKLGFTNIIVSSELNENEIIDLINEYDKRNNIQIRPFMLKGGSRALMYLKSNPFSKISINPKGYISDGINKYRIKQNYGIIELLEPKTEPIWPISDLIGLFYISD